MWVRRLSPRTLGKGSLIIMRPLPRAMRLTSKSVALPESS
jgi:hypothetical protein